MDPPSFMGSQASFEPVSGVLICKSSGWFSACVDGSRMDLVRAGPPQRPFRMPVLEGDCRSLPYVWPGP